MTDTPEPDLSPVFSFLDDDGFDIPPIPSKAHPEGKGYHVPGPDAETGLWLAALAEISRRRAAKLPVPEADVARVVMDDAEELTFNERVLGTAYTEMLADGVAWTRVQKLVAYAYIVWTFGKDAADNAARAGLLTGGKARIPASPAERRETSTTETTPPTP